MDDRIKSIALHIPLSTLDVVKVVLSFKCYDTVAERLRRSTRNRLGSSCVGSSPACVAYMVLPLLFCFMCRNEKHRTTTFLICRSCCVSNGSFCASYSSMETVSAVYTSISSSRVCSFRVADVALMRGALAVPNGERGKNETNMIRSQCGQRKVAFCNA